MPSMHILIFCHFGQNRSRYLAEYLIGLGYTDVVFAGIKDPDQEKIQKEIDQADVIIAVPNHVCDELRRTYQLHDARLICLQVEDRPEMILPDHRHLEGEEWTAFQQEYVYPALKAQLDRHLPL